jgi:hypothetical protein
MDGVPHSYPGIDPRPSGAPKQRKFLTMSQLLSAHNVQTHNNTLNNLVHGVGERVLFVNAKCEPPVPPKRGIFRKLHSYRDTVVKFIGVQSPVTREQFASFYKGPRHATYLRAAVGLGLNPLRPRDAMLKTFIKAEKHNLTLKPNVVPRVIQPRDPRYNVELGKYLRPIEHKLYDAIDSLFGAPTVFSPYNAFTQAKLLREKWDSFSHPVCVGLDASRFDQHVSADALEFEHSMYNSVFKSKELKHILSMQINNYGVARASDGWFKYTKKGSRMSGDMNTSMGNKFLMCVMAKSYIDQLKCEVLFVNNGDDCLMILEKRNVSQLDNMQKYFVEFGFKIVREKPVDVFEKIEFCQTSPVMSNKTWRMVRNVKTCLTKDVTCLNLGHSIIEYRRWMRDIGQCGLATCADMPVLSEFYHMLSRFGQDGAYQGSFDDTYKWYKLSSRNARCRHQQPDDYARYSFWLSTGMIPDVQLQLEKYFRDSIWGGDKRQLIENIEQLIQYG